MCSPREVVPGSQDPGNGGLHMLLGGEVGIVTCACTQAWSSFKWCSESPVLMHPETIVSCLLGCSRLFPRFPPSSCGALVPFRLCSHSQPQSSPWVLTSETQASAPSLHPPWWVSRQASQSGECWLTPILCVEISPVCPLHPCCCTLLCGSETSPLPTPSVHQ